MSFLGLAFMFIYLMPRSYSIAVWESRTEVQYWNLSTGSRIAYHHLAGEKEVPRDTPIIYLHGGPGGVVANRIMEVLSPLRKEDFDLYFYDQIGSGYSDRLSDITAYTLSRHQNDLAAIIAQLGKEKVILIGQSWGAILALHFLAEHPDQVAKVILTGPGPIYPLRPELLQRQPDPQLKLRPPTVTNQMANQKMQNQRMKFVSWYARTFGEKIASDQEVDGYFSFLNRELRKSTVCNTNRDRLRVSKGGYYSHIMTMSSLPHSSDPRPKLRKLNTPVLLLKGVCDNQAWGGTQEYLEVLANVELKIIEGAGHLIFEEAEVEYLEAISGFCVSE